MFLRCVRQSLTSLLFWKVNNMSTKCPTCSLSAPKGAIPKVKPDIRDPRERSCGEPASRNVNELDSASLRYVGVANLPELVKPAIAGEETLQSSQRTPRGGWRQRVGKGKSRNLRDPSQAATRRWESDGLIVARKGLTRLERRGPTVNKQRLKQNASA